MRYEKHKNAIYDKERDCFIPYDPRNFNYAIYFKECLPTDKQKSIEFMKEEISNIIDQNYENDESHSDFGDRLAALSFILLNL